MLMVSEVAIKSGYSPAPYGNHLYLHNSNYQSAGICIGSEFANSFDPDQRASNLPSDLDQNCLTLNVRHQQNWAVFGTL